MQPHSLTVLKFNIDGVTWIARFIPSECIVEVCSHAGLMPEMRLAAFGEDDARAVALDYLQQRTGNDYESQDSWCDSWAGSSSTGSKG